MTASITASRDSRHMDAVGSDSRRIKRHAAPGGGASAAAWRRRGAARCFAGPGIETWRRRGGARAPDGQLAAPPGSVLGIRANRPFAAFLRRLGFPVSFRVSGISRSGFPSPTRPPCLASAPGPGGVIDTCSFSGPCINCWRCFACAPRAPRHGSNRTLSYAC